MCLVDMPGYGYAKVNKSMRENLKSLIQNYLQHRPKEVLKMVLLLIDSRRGIQEMDREILSTLEKFGLKCLIVLTKIDKLKPEEVLNITQNIEKELQTLISSHNLITIVCTSSLLKEGFDSLRLYIMYYCGLHKNQEL